MTDPLWHGLLHDHRPPAVASVRTHRSTAPGSTLPVELTGRITLTAPIPATDLRMSMELGVHGLQLLLSGSLDLRTRARVDTALQLLDRSPFPGAVDLAGVRFADTAGLEPLATAARRRVHAHPAGSRLLRASPPVRRVLDALHVTWHPTFDLAAWDRGGVTRTPA